MEFLFSEEQRELKKRVIELCEQRLKPIEESLGETNILSKEVVSFLAKAGLFKLLVTKEYGNSTEMPSLISVCLVREQLARFCPHAELIFVMQGLGSYPIIFAGSKEQKVKYCPWIASGEKIFTFALTEPHAGSDVSSIETSATLEGDHFMVTGQKIFISLAPDADIYMVMVKTEKEKGAKGISALIVEKGYQGFDPGKRLNLVSAHPIGAPVFENCKVPKSNLIGELNGGFRIALKNLDFFRSTVGAGAVGMAQAALDEAIHYARSRTQFGKKISEFQAIQFKLADMATELTAARALVYRAGYLHDHGAERITMESSMAKLYATEAAQRIIDQALQIHGGYGVMKGYRVERLYREIRSMRVYEGTSEIQHLVIANMLLKQ
jgi:alkylation response protein AidB-like acyl-CoA dehydrogenase